jgi:hypothetical protein
VTGAVSGESLISSAISHVPRRGLIASRGASSPAFLFGRSRVEAQEEEPAMISPDSVNKILEPLLLATAISILVFAVATVLLWRDGKRMKALEGED